MYVGHIGEVHYMSTKKCTSNQTVEQTRKDSNNDVSASDSFLNCKHINSVTETRKRPAVCCLKSCKNHACVQNQDTATCGTCKSMLEDDKPNEVKKKRHTAYMRQYRLKQTPEDKKKQAAAKQKSRLKQTAEQKQKHVAQMRKYRSKQTEQKACCTANGREHNIFDSLISKFHNIASSGPFYICSCCDQMWYRHSVVSALKVRENNPGVDKYLTKKTSVQDIEWLCKMCERYLKKSKVPPCAVKNGMTFPPKPPFWDLNELECRLLAPRLAFQKIMQALRGKQFKITGNVVKVAADVRTSISLLPRLPTQTATIKVNLKRKLQYKSSALSLNVRPSMVMQAAQWLVRNSALYREEGVNFNQDWETSYATESLRDKNYNNCGVTNKNVDDNSETFPYTSEINTKTSNSTINESSKDNFSNDDNDWSEDEAEIPAGVTDTMLTTANFVENHEQQHVLDVAPAEGSRPLSIFHDKYSEELAYPGIFLGQKRPDNKDRITPVHYGEICKSELRRSDRRAAMCVENIFFKTKKIQMKLLLGKAQVAVRKCKGNKHCLKAGMLKKDGAVDRLVHLDEGFKFLHALRGSTPYWAKAKSDIFAIIRQLGPASLFCSFSSEETQWINLLRILVKVVDNKEYESYGRTCINDR